MKDFLRILAYLKPYKKKLAGSIVLSLLFAAANGFFMPLVNDILREISDKRLIYFNNHIFNALVLYAIYMTTKYSQFYLMYNVSNLVIIDMRMQLYEKLNYLSVDYYEKWKLGDLLTRIFSDVDRVKEAVVQNFEKVLPHTLTLLVIIARLFYLNWKLSLFSLLGIPGFIFITSYFSEKLKRVAGRIQRKFSDLTHISQEVLGNIRVVKSFTMENYEIKRFRLLCLKNFQANMKSVRYQTIMEPFIAYLQFFIFVAVIWYGGYEVAAGYLSGPRLGEFFMGLILLIDPVIALSKVYSITQQSLASAERLFGILDTKSSIHNKIDAIHLEQLKGDVKFENVSFKYSSDEDNVLKNINLHVKPGETVALVGQSGAGKSTIINLLPRFWDVTEGRILVDGLDVKDLDVRAFRKHIGIVPQESVMFRGTILENIKYGSPDATEDEIIAAAKKANAWEFITQFPNQLKTRLADKGVKLSGGQKQRIAIARAILRDPKLLILDEATSALDSESEQLVQEALEKLMKTRTTFVIAHRLSTIMHADKIVALNDGQIVEVGTHEELLAKNGHYANLYNIQFSKGELPK